MKEYVLNLLPVIASLLLGAFCTFLLNYSTIEAYSVTPFSEDAYGVFGSLWNGLYFVLLAGFGATILYVLLRRKKYRLISVLTGIALTTAIFMLSFVYALAVLTRFETPYVYVQMILFATVITAVADYTILKMRGRAADAWILIIGGALGALLGFSIATASTLLILALLAVYDVVAVYRGPVGKIARSGLDRFPGLSVSFRDVQMGLGDLTFYSMLSGHMLLHFGFLSGVASTAGILAGCLVSFRMLEKRGLFPGLPLPILFGLAAGLLAGKLTS